MNEENAPVFIEIDLSALDPEEAVHSLIDRAMRLHASDLFLLSNEDHLSFAIRHWGIMRHLGTISTDAGRRWINYIKAMAGMDIAETRRPLDGRWIYEADADGKKLDLRINTIPTLFGQDMTMRLLDRDIGLLGLDQVGMQNRDLSELTSILSSPSGLVLVTGPTGAGKTTTLYACIRHLNDDGKKINTLEDPIEYEIDGVRQSQINPRIDLGFSQLLRNILRQAPDIIMVGEIRDAETAQTAVQAANSGHLVFATLHAPVAAAAVQSMLALGVSPHFLGSCLLGVIAQRLVRTLCPSCRIQYDLSEAPETFDEIKPLLGRNDGGVMYGPGRCDECYHTGYGGRTGVFEVMAMSPEIRRQVANDATVAELHTRAVAHGMVPFRHGSLLKLAQGVTSTEEILRAVPTEFLGIEESWS